MAAAMLACGVLASAPAGALGASSAPVVSTGGSSNVSFSSALLYGYVDPNGLATGYVFQYGTTSGYGAQTPLAPAGSGKSSIKLSQTVTGLQPYTTYHFRIVAVNATGTSNGRDRTFRTAKVPLSLQITSVPDPVVFGSPFVVEGHLFGTGGANREVRLEANPFPYLGGFRAVGNPEVTDGAGGFSFPYLGLLENAQLRVVTVGGTLVTSPVVVESVAVRVAFHVARTRHRGRVRLYGTIAPAEVGALVGFQLLRPGNSINEGGTVVKPGTLTVSRFSRIVRLRHPGVYRALVKIADGAHVSAYSPPIFIR
ncbi:MAG TPA: fibronectin type III domain-containing protein [Solirubrobacteraceae bacterium]|jgi:hypothetical protein|nr:fibronectin type III domain-containing protein [Solirubrobacteraceae bacterium]